MKELSLEADSLSLGESTQIYCPFCDNAPPYSKSMSLTRVSGGAVFYCFRAVCNAKGMVNVNGSVRKSKETKDDSIVYSANLHRLQDVANPLWIAEGVRYNRDRNSFAFPVYDFLGRQIGWVDRSYSGRVPKAINYIDRDFPKLHFPRLNDATLKTVVLVEDIPSSIEVSAYIPSCALLGTTITSDMIEELTQHYDFVYLALDNDASAKAIKLSKELRPHFKSVRVLFMPKDPKDMDDEMLETIFGDL